jgi:short subunit dehydrogenase-like uncharacterized protein
VLGEVGVSAPQTIVADVADPSSLAAMAARTRVVLNLVGPYTLHGRPVIEACVTNGAHYADLTGETPFVRTVIDDYDGRAREAGVKVVPTCGFEALPADLAVQLAVEAARERWDETLSEADLEVTVSGGPGGLPRPSDILSGGTLQSVAAAVGFEGTASVSDSAALITDPVRAEQVRRRSPLRLRPRRGRCGAVVAAMAPAAFVNPAVIQRTAALLAAESDGAEPFAYREGVALRGGLATLPLRFVGAGVMAGTQSAISGLARVPRSMRRRLGRGMSKILPSSGFGPKGERLESWHWRMSLEARTSGGHAVEVVVEADGHPGYLATARMLGEAGLMLAEPGLTPDRAGCLTPATALGTAATDRFERARMRFSVAD